MRLVGLIVVGLLVLLGIFSSTYMLISPRRWLTLPRWLRGFGSMSLEKNAKGLGASRVRLIGGLILAGLLWECYLTLNRR